MSARLAWLICLCIAMACACGDVKDITPKDAAIDGAGSGTCVLDHSKLDSCKL